jgi:triacylglycerol lipase
VQRPTPGKTLRVLLREADAIRQQSMLLHRNLAPRGVAMGPIGGAEDVVFLLHGVLATAGVFGPLEARLRRAGVEHVASFTYLPFRGVASLSQELRTACLRIPERARLHLVGHSLGGVVARHFVQEGGGGARVRQTISLASPFHGTEVVRRLPSGLAHLTPLTRELAPDSELLGRLREPGRWQAGVPHTSFVAAGDMMVTPASSAAFPHGEVIVIEGVGHNALLFDAGVAEQVCERIVAAREADALAAELARQPGFPDGSARARRGPRSASSG